MAKGKVYLVGAGPGDVGLLTLKAKSVLQQADVVVYDALVSDSVMTFANTQAKKIYVGKRASHHSLPQEQINQLLLEQAQTGQCVVRLKGGDPFLFGRGGEELELLAQHGIPFEVVPGVTSSIAVPAYNGIPVTHRDHSSSLHIITGHQKAGKSYDIDFDALVRTKGTLVFLMGVSALADICDQLMKAGMAPDTPAGVLQQGTTAKQKRIVATLQTLPQEVKIQGIQTPAIIVVGHVCALAKQFSWFDQLPLSQVKVLVPRPKELSSTLSEQLRAKGAEVLELPTVQTVPLNTVQVADCLPQIQRFEWIVLTSPTGVSMFFTQLQQAKIDLRVLASTRFAVVGSGTAKALQQYGIFADVMPEVYDGEHLAQALITQGVQGKQILIARAKIAGQQLPQLLAHHGAQVTDMATYETQYCQNPQLESQLQSVDYVLFTSSSAVDGLAGSAPNIDFTALRALCIGSKTAATAKRYGMQTVISKQSSIDSLIQLLCEQCNQ